MGAITCVCTFFALWYIAQGAYNLVCKYMYTNNRKGC